jgi:predicted glycosyltransferase
LRTLDIAASLCKALDECSILVLTDLATIGRFKLANKVDYIHLPALNSRDRQSSLSPGLNIEYGNTLKMRRKIAESTIKTFHPDLVMLDDSLLDVPYAYDTQKIVSGLAEELPNAKVVWGLSDTLGEPSTVIRQWARYEVLALLDRFADEIFVFGTRQIFDVAKAYRVPERIAQKFIYTGYLTRRAVPPRRVGVAISQTNQALPMVVLATEGSSRDFAMIDAYLRFLESDAGGLEVRSFIVAGPTIGSQEKRHLAVRAKKLPNVVFHRFGKHLLHYVRYADLVICNGGYNVMCEILAHRKTAIVVPNLTEQPDNVCRARLFQERGLVTVMQPSEFHPRLYRR